MIGKICKAWVLRWGQVDSRRQIALWLEGFFLLFYSHQRVTVQHPFGQPLLSFSLWHRAYLLSIVLGSSVCVCLTSWHLALDKQPASFPALLCNPTNDPIYSKWSVWRKRQAKKLQGGRLSRSSSTPSSTWISGSHKHSCTSLPPRFLQHALFWLHTGVPFKMIRNLDCSHWSATITGDWWKKYLGCNPNISPGNNAGNKMYPFKAVDNVIKGLHLALNLVFSTVKIFT